MPPKRAASAGAASTRNSTGKANVQSRAGLSRNDRDNLTPLPAARPTSVAHESQKAQTPSRRTSDGQVSQTPHTGRVTRRQVIAHPNDYTLEEGVEDPEKIGRPSSVRSTRRSSEPRNTRRGSLPRSRASTFRVARLPGVQEEEEDDGENGEEGDQHDDEIAVAPAEPLFGATHQQPPESYDPDTPVPSIEPHSALLPRRSPSLRPGESVSRWLSGHPDRYATPAVQSELGQGRSSSFDFDGVQGIIPHPIRLQRNSEPGGPTQTMQNLGPLTSSSYARNRARQRSWSRPRTQAPDAIQGSHTPYLDGSGSSLQVQDDSNRDLWEIFLEETKRGFSYRRKRYVHVSMLLAILLLRSVLCSAGPICEHNHATWLLIQQFWADPSETIALCGVYTLLISGLHDSLAGVNATIWEIGTRTSRRQPLFQSWSGFWSNSGAFFTRYVLPIVVDAVDKVFEPVVIMILTLALRWQQTWVSDQIPAGILAFNTSLCLHVFKWFCQAVERKYGLREHYWLRKPVVSAALVILALVALSIHWQEVSFPLRGDYRAARAYWRSEGYAWKGNASTINVASWAKEPTRAAATRAYRITSILVVGGVLPSVSGLD